MLRRLSASAAASAASSSASALFWAATMLLSVAVLLVPVVNSQNLEYGQRIKSNESPFFFRLLKIAIEQLTKLFFTLNFRLLRRNALYTC